MAQGTGRDMCCPPRRWLPMPMPVACSWSKLSPGPACPAGRTLPDPPNTSPLDHRKTPAPRCLTEPQCKQQGTEAEHMAVTVFAEPEPPASSATLHPQTHTQGAEEA